MEELSEKILNLCKERGLSQEELGYELGVSRRPYLNGSEVQLNEDLKEFW